MAKKLLLFLCLFVAVTAHALYEVGDVFDEQCWDTLDGKFCASYAPGAILVIIHSAGWCGPCNEEMGELATKVGNYNPFRVIFIDVLAAGWSQSAKPDKAFLKEWKQKHNIPANIILASKSGDYGRDFFRNPSIPNVAIIGTDDKLTWKAIGPEVSEILKRVDQLE